MDCRYSYLLAALLGGTAGCLHQDTAPNTGLANKANAPATTESPAPNNSEDKPRVHYLGRTEQPKPSTCVAVGKYQESLTNNPDRSPAEVEQFREEARKQYQRAIDLDSSYLPAYQALAQLYETLGDYERATKTYQKALKKHPKDASLWFEVGMCQARHKEFDPSLASLRKATELEPDNRQYAKTLGLCLARAGRYDESYACLKKVVGDAQAHYDLGRMLLHLDQNEAGKRQIEMAAQADPQFGPAQEFLAALEGRSEQPLAPPDGNVNLEPRAN